MYLMLLGRGIICQRTARRVKRVIHFGIAKAEEPTGGSTAVREAVNIISRFWRDTARSSRLAGRLTL